jgi:DNA-binding NtrC family response regulator
VRELRNLLRRILSLGVEKGIRFGLDEMLACEAHAPAGEQEGDLPLEQFRTWIQQAERWYLCELMRQFPTTDVRCAVSGISERTLHRKLNTLRMSGTRDAAARPPFASLRTSRRSADPPEPSPASAAPAGRKQIPTPTASGAS